MADKKWTPKLVAERLEEAANTLRNLPDKRIQGYRSSWPDTIPDWTEYGWTKARVRRFPPTPDQIDRMDEVMNWLRWLSREEACLLWLRAERIPWKLILRRIGGCRDTAWRRWMMGLVGISSRLDYIAKEKMSGQLSVRHI